MTDLVDDPLFQAVLAEPEEDAPRLVLADKLLELGDPRGEFIQLQVHAAREEDRARAKDLAERANKLLKKHQPAWNKPIKAFVRSTIYSRGFVDQYLAEPNLVFEGMATVVRHHPVRALRVQSMKKGDATKLGGVEELARLRRLDVGSNRITAADAVALFSSPHLASLRELTASCNPMGDAGVEAIAKRMDRLTTLRVDDVEMGAPGVAAIAGAAFVSRLERLAIHVQSCPTIDREAFLPLARAPLVALRELMIWNCKIGDDGARALAESPHLGQLETLRCVGCEFTVEGMRAIARSPHLKKLQWFEPFAGDTCPPAVKEELQARFRHLG
jgi:uncharacterized protein (TIGR02996 family)